MLRPQHVSSFPLIWVLAAAAGELRRDPETFPGQMGHVIPPPQRVLGLPRVSSQLEPFLEKPLEREHILIGRSNHLDRLAEMGGSEKSEIN